MSISTAIPDYSRKGGQAKNATLHGLELFWHVMDVRKTICGKVIAEPR